MTSSLEPLNKWEFDQAQQELSPTKIIQMVLIGCISRSRGQKLGFQNAILKNLLV